jgi:hypothetical protein
MAETKKYLGKDGNYYNSPVEASLGRNIGSSVNYQGNVSAQVATAQAQQRKPVMSKDQIDGGGQIKWVGSVDGEWRVIMPIGSPLVGSKAAGYTAGTAATTTTTKTKTPDQQAAYDGAKALAQSFVDTYGGNLNDYFDTTTGKVTRPTDTVIKKKFTTPTAKKEVSRKANGDGTFTVTYDDGSTEVIGTKTVVTNPTVVDDSAANAALQAQINALIEQGRLAEARRLEDKLRYDNELKAQAAASKLAYDTAAKDKADAIKVERVSAYQTLKTEFEKYGLGSLVESVEALILNGTPKSEATLKLRATPQYQLRFAGNTARLAAGKNLYDESTYLALENDFQTSFEAYGQKSLLGNTRESAQAMFAEYIGSDKSPTEIKDRIRLAVDEVSNRKDIRAEFQKFFPEITDSDLVSYFLKPKETLSTLNAKVRVAQIGSAASAQGLNASLTTATDLEQLGLTEQQARTGYQRVATDLPGIQKLGAIDNMDIGQTTAENAYLKGLASEQRKIDKAAERERNRYAQSSGMNKVSLTDAKPAGQY